MVFRLVHLDVASTGLASTWSSKQLTILERVRGTRYGRFIGEIFCYVNCRNLSLQSWSIESAALQTRCFPRYECMRFDRSTPSIVHPNESFRDGQCCRLHPRQRSNFPTCILMIRALLIFEHDSLIINSWLDERRKIWICGKRMVTSYLSRTRSSIYPRISD